MKSTYIIKIKLDHKYQFYGKYQSLQDAIYEYEILKSNGAKVILLEHKRNNEYVKIEL